MSGSRDRFRNGITAIDKGYSAILATVKVNGTATIIPRRAAQAASSKCQGTRLITQQVTSENYHLADPDHTSSDRNSLIEPSRQGAWGRPAEINYFGDLTRLGGAHGISEPARGGVDMRSPASLGTEVLSRNVRITARLKNP